MTHTQLTSTNHRKTKKTRFISILNAKGGVGKSSLGENVGDKLAMLGYPTLFIECDFQRNTSKRLTEPIENTMHEVLTKDIPISQATYKLKDNFFIVPAHPDLDKAAKHIIVNAPKSYYSLKKEVDTLTEYDFILFDYFPNWTAVTETALRASDELLIPVLLEQYSIDGLVELFDKITKELFDHELKILGIVPYNVDFSTKLANHFLPFLNEKFKDRLTNIVRTDQQIPQSQVFRQSIFDFNPHSKAAKDIEQVVQYIIHVGGNDHE
jgi:chromosome partitioning protein